MGCPQQCQRTRLAIAIVRGTGIVDAQEAVCLLTLTMLGYGRKILFRRGYSQMAGIQQPQSAPDEMNATTAPGRHSHNMVDRRRSEERRVGQEGVRTCRSRRPPDYYKKQKQRTHEENYNYKQKKPKQ